MRCGVYFRVGSALDELWPSVADILGRKKYARHTAQDASSLIVAYGWRKYRDVDVIVLPDT